MAIQEVGGSRQGWNVSSTIPQAQKVGVINRLAIKCLSLAVEGEPSEGITHRGHQILMTSNLVKALKSGFSGQPVLFFPTGRLWRPL